MPANHQLRPIILYFIIKGSSQPFAKKLLRIFLVNNTPQETLYNNNNIKNIHVIITNKYSNNSGFTNILIQKVNLYIQITVNEHCM